jgi:hypothetical protein
MVQRRYAAMIRHRYLVWPIVIGVCLSGAPWLVFHEFLVGRGQLASLHIRSSNGGSAITQRPRAPTPWSSIAKAAPVGVGAHVETATGARRGARTP